MRITFFAAKSYDKDSFNKIKEQYPELELEYWETELSRRPHLMYRTVKQSVHL